MTLASSADLMHGRSKSPKALAASMEILAKSGSAYMIMCNIHWTMSQPPLALTAIWWDPVVTPSAVGNVLRTQLAASFDRALPCQVASVVVCTPHAETLEGLSSLPLSSSVR